MSPKNKHLFYAAKIKFDYFVLGGPVTLFEKNEKRHVLVGTVHGAFANCDNKLPGIYVRVDDSSNLQFLHKEALHSGMAINVQHRQ